MKPSSLLPCRKWEQEVGLAWCLWLWAWPEVSMAHVWHQAGVCGKVFCFQVNFFLLTISVFCWGVTGHVFPIFAKDSWGAFCSTISAILIQPKVFSEIIWSCFECRNAVSCYNMDMKYCVSSSATLCWAQALSLSALLSMKLLLLSCSWKITIQESSELWALLPTPPLSLLSSSLSSSPSSALLYSKWPQQFLSCRGT